MDSIGLIMALIKSMSHGEGKDGKSAYAYAVEGGYTGTEEEFAAKLAQEKFANPEALTFTGAATGSYDGSQPLTVNIPSGAGGGREIYEAEYVVDVDTHEFEATLPYKSRVLGVFIKNFYSAAQVTSNAGVCLTLDGTQILGSVTGPGTAINANWRGSFAFVGFNTISFSSGSGTTGNGNATANLSHIGSESYNVMVRNMIEGVQKVGLIHSSSSSTIAAGTTYTVLAERVE